MPSKFSLSVSSEATGAKLTTGVMQKRETDSQVLDPQAPVRRQIKARPAGAAPCGVTSGTARRILQSLERMSSPLAVSPPPHHAP